MVPKNINSNKSQK